MVLYIYTTSLFSLCPYIIVISICMFKQVLDACEPKYCCESPRIIFQFKMLWDRRRVCTIFPLGAGRKSARTVCALLTMDGKIMHDSLNGSRFGEPELKHKPQGWRVWVPECARVRWKLWVRLESHSCFSLPCDPYRYSSLQTRICYC